MSILKKLASQTAVYGLSSIFGRFLNYLLVPLYTYHFTAAEYGVVAEFYAYAGFFSVLLLFGFETGYFRFRDREHPGRDVAYSTALIFVLLANLGFFGLILLINSRLSAVLNYAEHPEYVLCFSLILILDAVAAIPFARLRAENRAFRFAGIKIIEIAMTVLLSLFFIIYCPRVYAANPESWVAPFYNPAIGIGYIFIANLIASGFKFLLLSPQLKGLAWGFDRVLFGRMMRYSAPMVVIGFAGIINEMLDRVLLKYLLPYDAQTNMKMLGIYSACYKLSILMSLFIQAFRYAAEPFFFAYADNSDARKIYAMVLKFFVIFCVFIFLLVTLFIDFFKYFVGEEFRAGLEVVPILLLANLFLGIYVNLSIWYKLTDRTLMGAWVSLAGAALTIALNVWLIPQFGYIGSAWATLACYAAMAAVSYLLGQKYYPVDYAVKRIIAYIGLGIGLYSAHGQLLIIMSWQPWQLAGALLLLYVLITTLCEQRTTKS
ncbi:MAG: polysaccharide biosynthesis C-terminal domain-containing protein [Methylobacter sp.]|nr:polysaccharide biosynthesis C-terminal domain-containing protein [Methylobacter sp.]MDP2097564.1 polysaccharide biosynthesis C-terminal domain-containing protein [Methylobacter sp.]MDP2427762.1 polysaccharide biosynthesis C-terminal domain-containing protein [Methylobacter sp.]MDP3053967.1 polysaccharide biosynthesis C-terminal domain-containing protein [Methylobacter sp.]MDP3363709.1 polysaccharide biosynthesis C-terminal domain-containing protein [Methylobacter sp.]